MGKMYLIELVRDMVASLAQKNTKITIKDISSQNFGIK